MERRPRPALPRHRRRMAEPRGAAQQPRSKAPDLRPLVERLPGNQAAGCRRRRAEPRQRALSAGPGRRSRCPRRPGQHAADALPAPGARQPDDLHPFGPPLAQPGRPREGRRHPRAAARPRRLDRPTSTGSPPCTCATTRPWSNSSSARAPTRRASSTTRPSPTGRRPGCSTTASGRSSTVPPGIRRPTSRSSTRSCRS